MNRGDVWWVNFEPIVSNESANKFLNRVQVVPLTSNVSKLYPSEAYVIVNDKQDKALADQITTVTKARLVRMMGKLSSVDMRKIENAIRTQLDLP